MGPAAPFVSLSPFVGSRSSGTTMRTAALTVTLYVLRQLIIFSPHNYHPCRFIWLFSPHASSSSSLSLFLSFSEKHSSSKTTNRWMDFPSYLLSYLCGKLKKKKKGRTEEWWWGFIESRLLKFVWRQYCFGRKQCDVFVQYLFRI